LDGENLLTISRRQREDLLGNRIAMVSQDPLTSLNPAYTVGEQVAETIRRHHGVSRSAAWGRAVSLLDMVGIPNPAARAKAYPHEFSGGMRQRATIAIAISCEPDLLIADEPTTGL